MKEAVLTEARDRFKASKSVFEKHRQSSNSKDIDDMNGGGRNLVDGPLSLHSESSLLERKVSMLDIGRSPSNKGVESPPGGRRNSSLGITMSLPSPEMIAAMSQKAADNRLDQDDIEEDDAEDDLPEVPFIQINPGQQQQPLFPQPHQQQHQQNLPQDPKKLAKQSSEGSQVDHNNNIAGIGLDVPGNSYVSSLALLHTAKRRASVAVWSDDNLMKLAQNATDKGSSPKSSTTPPPGRGASGLSNPKNSTTSPLQSESSDISIDYRPSACEDVKRVLAPFPNNVAVMILEYLNPKLLIKLRRLSHGMAALLEDPHHGLFESIDLSPWHKKIDDTILQRVLIFCGHCVKTLNLRNCWQVTDKGLSHISEYAPCIEYINLASVWDVTDTGVAALAKLVSNLHYIDLSNCRKLTDAAILAILAFSPGLKDIHLSYCKNLTDASMDHATWSTVKSINMQRCTAISDTGFLSWVNLPTTTTSSPPSFLLQELILSDCSFLTDAAVTSIAQTCPNLQLLSLSFCCALTEECIEPLTKSCLDLRVLDLSFCGSAVTDTCLSTISQNSKMLERLSVRGCVLITNAGVSSLKGLPNMKMVNMTQCRNIKIPADEVKAFGWTFLNGGELVTDEFGEKEDGRRRRNNNDGKNMMHCRVVTR
ncbi:UNVERIFIED_CONTAM: hypothetical protein HDU68_008022 [Siphonaria sp. JEL0065]|nr:hypothetical protein HDU68_008022 [Siphonaria sp. JEL0065]